MAKYKYVRVTMPDGSKYDIPLSIIATDRANYYAKREGGEFNSKEWHKVFNEEYNITMEDDYEGLDWLANNMNWKDVKSYAVKVEDYVLTEADLQEAICNGEKEIIEKEEV